MRRRFEIYGLWLIFALTLSIAKVSSAAQFEEGRSAFNRGDYATALKLHRPLAIQGHAWAQVDLAFMYLRGLGVPKDLVEAARWFRLAANQGVIPAQHVLGMMYAAGEGVPQNYVEANRWYRRAATQGDALAQFSLGSAYETGVGVQQNYVEAHKWFNLAAGGGHKEAHEARGKVELRMTLKQIALAQQLAITCRNSSYRQCGDGTPIETTSPTPVGEPTNRVDATSHSVIPLQKQGGTFVVPVLINGAITLNFIVDSGAADVTIPADVVTTLIRTGTLKQTDFLGKKIYVLADGSQVPSETFRIRSLTVGNKTVENITGSVAPVEGSLLLGQSFLARFKSWSIDNGKQTLLLH